MIEFFPAEEKAADEAAAAVRAAAALQVLCCGRFFRACRAAVLQVVGAVVLGRLGVAAVQAAVGADSAAAAISAAAARAAIGKVVKFKVQSLCRIANLSNSI